MDENSTNKFSKKPEILLLSDIPIELLSKIIVTTESDNYHIIKYLQGDVKKISVIKTEGAKFVVTENSKIGVIKEIFLKYKETFLVDVLQNNVSSLSKFIRGSDGGINIDLALNYLEANQASFSKFLDK